MGIEKLEKKIGTYDATLEKLDIQIENTTDEDYIRHLNIKRDNLLKALYEDSELLTEQVQWGGYNFR